MLYIGTNRGITILSLQALHYTNDSSCHWKVAVGVPWRASSWLQGFRVTIENPASSAELQNMGGLVG